MDRCSATISRVITGVAADVHIKRKVSIQFRTQTGFSQLNVVWTVLAFAIRTQHANESLCQHTVQRRNKVIRLDTHVQESANDVDNVVRVNCRKYEVTGQRGLDCNLRGFSITNLTDHYLVGVVSQDRA